MFMIATLAVLIGWLAFVWYVDPDRFRKHAHVRALRAQRRHY
jgi:hypothetical protein